MEDAESRLKRFLHYGSELRLYIPCGNLKNTFQPNAVRSIEELLGDDEWAEKIVPTIEKVDQLQTSIAPSALLFALAMVIRKARVNMEKKPSSECMITETEVGSEIEDDAKSNSIETEIVPEPRNNVLSSQASSEKKNYKPQKWDLIMRDAYKVARKLSDNKAENLFLFTKYLREIAKTEGKKGFGQGWRATVAKWYEFQPSLSLALSATKIYASASWSHVDLLKLLRWKYHQNEAKDAIFLYILFNFNKVKEKYEHSNDQNLKRVMKHLKLIDDLRHAKDAEHALEYVNNRSVTLDFVPPAFLTSHAIWLLLIQRMTPQELLLLICRLSRLKMFKYPEIVAEVVSKFEELNQPKQSSPDSTPVLINPFQVFITRKHYEEGPNLAVEFQYLQRKHDNTVEENDRPRNVVDPRRVPQEVHRQPPPKRNPEIIDCLNNVFNNSISSFAATGKKFLIAVDAQAANASKRCLYERFVTIEEAALLVTLGVIRAEPVHNVKLVTFVKEPQFVREIPISVCNEGQLTKTTDTMDSLKSKIHKDDCVNGNVGKLIRMVTESKDKYDVFIVLSDNLLSVDDAYSALRSYKNDVHADAKIITCCLIGRHKKYLELIQPDMLLISGFDKNVGNIIQACSRNSF